MLSRAAGLAKARALLLLGERIDADEAYRIALVSAALDDGALRGQVDAPAAHLAAMPPTAARLMKQNLNDAGSPELPSDAPCPSSLRCRPCTMRGRRVP